jgi:hypothetical protein
MKRARNQFPPGVFQREPRPFSSRNFLGSTVPWKCSLTLFAIVVLGMCSASAFAQRGGGGGRFHGGVGIELGGGGGKAAVAAVTGGRANSLIANAKGSSGISSTPRAQPPISGVVGSSSSASSSSSALPSATYPRANDEIVWRDSAQTYPREVTIGFPPRSPSEVGLARGGGRRTALEGQGTQFWADAPQRGAFVPPVSAPTRSAPVIEVPLARPPAMTLPRPPAASRHFVSPPRVAEPVATPEPFAFLRNRIGLPPRVFGGPRGRPGQPIFGRPIFGGFGFFGFGGLGFGYPFWAFVGPNCNPFSAWPWVYGCNSFGYWDGYEGFGPAFDSSVYEQENEQEIEPQSQEPETFTWAPPPESSPEEIEAEKPLTVLFLKNGAVYAVTDYWIQDNKLYYVTSYGGENTIDMDEIDLQKTVDVNANRGVEFILKPSPEQNPQDPPQPFPDQPH